MTLLKHPSIKQSMLLPSLVALGYLGSQIYFFGEKHVWVLIFFLPIYLNGYRKALAQDKAGNEEPLNRIFSVSKAILLGFVLIAAFILFMEWQERHQGITP